MGPFLMHYMTVAHTLLYYGLLVQLIGKSVASQLVRVAAVAS